MRSSLLLLYVGHSMWSDRNRWTAVQSPGEHKLNFIPALVGPFLEVTLVPQPDLRNVMIPIFHDTMDWEQRRSGNFKQVGGAHTQTPAAPLQPQPPAGRLEGVCGTAWGPSCVW